MKILKFSVVLLLFYTIKNNSLLAQVKFLSAPIDVQFLNRGDKPIEGKFTIRSGQIFVVDKAGNETPSPLGRIGGPKGAAFTGETETLLGAPAVVFSRQEIETPTSLSNAKSTLGAVARSDAVIFVQETRTLSASVAKQVITGFTVSQQTNGKFAELGRFWFQENTFNQYLSEIWPVSDAMLAIITRSSRHPKINTLFIFNIQMQQLVGMREFSAIQYLPIVSSFWIVQSISNCDNIDEIFTDAKRKAQVFELFTNGEISSDFQSLDGIAGDIAWKKNSAPNGKSSNASMPMVPPQPQTESSDTRPPTATEKSILSTSWPIVTALIMAVIGLLRLLFKRRS